jgi:hypothetical protein
MAGIQEAISRLTFMFTSEGADKVASDMNKVGDATENLTVKSQTASTASLSLEKSFDNLERRFVTTVRAQQDYEKVQNSVNAAVAQNPALQDRANVVLAAAAAKFDAASGSASTFNATLDAGRGALLGYAAGIGPIGAVLGSFGPWGVAAAAGIGLVSAAFEYLNQNASKFGDASISINKFSQATGLTTTEVRGLSEAAEKAGVSGDSITASFERFTANLDTARTGTGALFDSIAKINPALAVELASTRSGADAWDILAKAVNTTTDATTRAALAKAAFGRGGVADVPVLVATDQAGGLAAYSDEVQKATGITDQLTQHTAALKAEIDATNKLTANVYASIYSDAVLTRQAQFAKAQLEIAQAFKTTPAQYYLSQDSGFSPTPSQSPVAAPSSEAAGPSSVGNTEALKAADAATSDLARSTDRLTAAQVENDAAQFALSAAENGGTASIGALADARKNAGAALEVLSNQEKSHIAALSGAATGDEILQQKTDALTAAFDKGTISADTYNRAMHGDSANVFAGIQDQLEVRNAITKGSVQAEKKPSGKGIVSQGRDRRKARILAMRDNDYVRCHSASAA